MAAVSSSEATGMFFCCRRQLHFLLVLASSSRRSRSQRRRERRERRAERRRRRALRDNALSRRLDALDALGLQDQNRMAEQDQAMLQMRQELNRVHSIFVDLELRLSNIVPQLEHFRRGSEKYLQHWMPSELPLFRFFSFLLLLLFSLHFIKY